MSEKMSKEYIDAMFEEITGVNLNTKVTNAMDVISTPPDKNTSWEDKITVAGEEIKYLSSVLDDKVIEKNPENNKLKDKISDFLIGKLTYSNTEFLSEVLSDDTIARLGERVKQNLKKETEKRDNQLKYSQSYNDEIDLIINKTDNKRVLETRHNKESKYPAEIFLKKLGKASELKEKSK